MSAFDRPLLVISGVAVSGDFAEGVGFGAIVVTAREEQFSDSAALLRRFGDLAGIGASK